jgi:hypothetical protein
MQLNKITKPENVCNIADGEAPFGKSLISRLIRVALTSECLMLRRPIAYYLLIAYLAGAIMAVSASAEGTCACPKDSKVSQDKCTPEGTKCVPVNNGSTVEINKCEWDIVAGQTFCTLKRYLVPYECPLVQHPSLCGEPLPAQDLKSAVNCEVKQTGWSSPSCVAIEEEEVFVSCKKKGPVDGKRGWEFKEDTCNGLNTYNSCINEPREDEKSKGCFFFRTRAAWRPDGISYVCVRDKKWRGGEIRLDCVWSDVNGTGPVEPKTSDM